MARFFNGTSDYLRHSAAVVSAAPLTLSCWAIRGPGATGARALLGLFNSGSATSLRDQFLITLNGTSGTVQGFAGDSAGNSNSNLISVASVGVWGHCLYRIDSATSRQVFYNGSSSGVSTVSRVPSGLDRTSVGIQDNASATPIYYPDTIAEAAIWNTNLTNDEITSLSRGVSPLLIRPESLAFYSPIGGRYSPEIDLVGGANLTVTGTTYADNPSIQYPKRRRIAYDPSATPPAGGVQPAWAVSSQRIITCGVI